MQEIKYGFDAYYEYEITITYYRRKNIDSTSQMMMTEKDVGKIENQIKLIISNIDIALETANYIAEKEFLNVQKKIAYAEILMCHAYLYTFDILTQDLKVIKTTEYKGTFIPFEQFGIETIGQLDYLTHTDELKLLLQSNGMECNSNIEIEDELVLYERRQIVLQFRHPKYYIDNDGNYNYNRIKFALWDMQYEIKQCARSYRLRYKSKKHFDASNTSKYDYAKMKRVNESLHNEFRLYYKIFKKFALCTEN